MSDTGRPGADPTEPGRRPSWGPTGATTPTQPAAVPPPVTSWQPPQPGATPPPAAAASSPAAVPPTTGGQPPAAPPAGRPAWVLWAIIGAVVFIVVAIIIGIVVSNGSDDEAAPPAVASTVLLPSPTPAVAPVPRAATSAFASALPVSVLQYALATSTDNPTWTAAGALEAYTETYTDGAAGTVTVNAGQWETAAEATTFATSLVAAVPSAAAPDPTATAAPGAPVLPASGDVTAAGAVVGTYTIVDAGDGTGVAIWTNNTSVFQVTAPLTDIVDFYSAYPL